MSAGGADEWLMVDLGTPVIADRVVMHWIHPARRGEILVSKDGDQWQQIGDLGRIKEGGHARVEIPSLGDKVFSATITEISWISTNMDVAQPPYYTVELTVPNSQLELKPGFKALVRFGAAE